MIPKTEIILDMLTSDSVSVLKRQYYEINGQRFYTDNERNAFVNSKSDKANLKSALSDEHYKAILAVWGDNPTVEDPTVDEI